jgi:hypothetical protein
MQAMNGSASPFRSRGRLIGCCMALALALSALVLAPVASAKTKPPVTTYIAAGDSIAFGYSQEKFEANFPNEAPAYFEVNYPNELAKTLRKEKTSITGSKGLTVVNNACPGETSDSLFGTGSLGKAVDATATQACPYHFVNGLPLHTGVGTLSQAENTLLELNPSFGKGVSPPNHEVKLLTFGIGGNDELASIAKCKAEVKEEYETTGKSKYDQNEEKEPPEIEIADAVKDCIVEHTPAVAEHIAGNLKTFLGLVRSSSYGNYTGPIEVLGNYNPDSFLLPGSDALQHVVNNFLKKATEEVGGIFVDPTPKTNPPPEGGSKEKKALEKYTEIFNAKDIAANEAKCKVNAEKEKEEGKLVIYPCTPEGDIHPTEAGDKLFAKLLAEAL